MTWIWNGCLPDFPWWCDGFLYFGIATIVFAVCFGWFIGRRLD